MGVGSEQTNDRRKSSATPNANGASIVLVGQDGIQHPPIRFPKGSHLLQFLTCLEAGLGPDGALDPPLRTEFGKGKVFPRLQRRSVKQRIDTCVSQSTVNENESSTSITTTTTGSDLATTPIVVKSSSPTTIGDAVDEEQEGDFVFRIVNSKSNGIKLKKKLHLIL